MVEKVGWWERITWVSRGPSKAFTGGKKGHLLRGTEMNAAEWRVWAQSSGWNCTQSRRGQRWRNGQGWTLDYERGKWTLRDPQGDLVLSPKGTSWKMSSAIKFVLEREQK